MSKKPKKKQESTTSEEEVYLAYTIEKLIIKNCENVTIIQSGNPNQPPPKPPGGGQ